MNTMRVFLHDLLWQQDPDGFRHRIDTFLALCAKHHIRPVFVFFDSVWDPNPKLGPQRPPIPGVHNSGWVQSPGRAALSDPAQYPRLETYVKGVIGAFADVYKRQFRTCPVRSMTPRSLSIPPRPSVSQQYSAWPRVSLASAATSRFSLPAVSPMWPCSCSMPLSSTATACRSSSSSHRPRPSIRWRPRSPASTSRSVSYTHLDVYKRQRPSHLAHRK